MKQLFTLFTFGLFLLSSCTSENSPEIQKEEESSTPSVQTLESEMILLAKNFKNGLNNWVESKTLEEKFNIKVDDEGVYKKEFDGTTISTRFSQHHQHKNYFHKYAVNVSFDEELVDYDAIEGANDMTDDEYYEAEEKLELEAIATVNDFKKTIVKLFKDNLPQDGEFTVNDDNSLFTWVFEGEDDNDVYIELDFPFDETVRDFTVYIY